MKRLITTLFIFAIAVGVLTPVSFSLVPQTSFVTAVHVHAEATPPAASTDPQKDLTFGNIGSCGVLFGELGNCLAYFFYFLPYWVGGVYLEIGAWFLDICASLTLSSDMITNSSFIQTGWALMRDIANVFFILILLYIAICIILEIHLKGGGDPKKMIWYTILMAILINFSMFVTSIVIDTSNTLALVFYNQISVSTQAGTAVAVNPDVVAAEKKVTGGDGKIQVVPPKQIAVSLASAFHPQAFSHADFWDGLRTSTHVLTTPTVPAGTMISILVMMGALFIMVAYSFVIAGFAFLGRMVELFILIIFSPIAFVSFIVPGLKEMDYFGWTKWWSRLVDVSFAAPLYFMMLYLISLILNQGLFGGQNHATSALTTANWTVVIVGDVLIPAIFLFIMLSYATKFVLKASGTLGSAIGGAAKVALVAAGGFALGSASGALASAGRNSLGRFGARLSENKWINDNKAKAGFNPAGWASRAALSAGKGLQTSTFDVRQTKAGAGFTKVTGMSLGSVGALSMKAAAGGYSNIKVRKQASLEKKIALIGHDASYVKSIDEKQKDKEGEVADFKNTLEDKKIAYEALDKQQTAAKTAKTEAEKKLSAAENTLIQVTATGNPTAIAAAQQKVTQFTQEVATKTNDLTAAQTLAAPARLAYEDAKEEIKARETGYTPERDQNGNIVRRDPKNNNQPTNDGTGKVSTIPPPQIDKPVMVITATGALQAAVPPATYTKQDVLDGAGIEALKKLSAQAKTAPGKEYLLNKAASKYNVPDDSHTRKRNAAGDLVGFHFTPKNEIRTTSNKMVQTFQTFATSGAVLGTVAGIASTVLTGGNAAVGFAVGTAVAGAVAKREFSKGAGTKVRDADIDGVIAAEHAVGTDHKAHAAEVKTNAPKSFGQVMGATGDALLGGGGGGGGGGHSAPKAAGHSGGHDGGHGGGHGGH